VTAKAIASLDYFSGGRFIFGIGGGWNVEEMNNHGVEYKMRFKQMREHILAMKALWTEEEASFHGEFVQMEKSWAYPKPTQTPHPPILLGGETDYTLRRVVDYCDGWYPRATKDFDPAVAMQRLKTHADEAGRSMDDLTVSVFRAPADAQSLASYHDAGITRAIFEVPDAPRDDILKTLDEYTKIMA
jgi:alkanesulfonate monooxygenase SsuD/methylene tetrahydromethanopterin reductase-like flavin-dependent oxidoreductase (luciferase family)